MNNRHAGIENLKGYILACSKFIALALIIHFVSGCSNSVYPTSNIATELSPDIISDIMEYEINNSISYKGFCGCENFYDLYNKPYGGRLAIFNNRKSLNKGHISDFLRSYGLCCV